MTDNALVYRRSRRFASILAEAGARHILTPPYTPRWNGKVERFNQHPARRMGLRPQLAELTPPRPQPPKLPPLLQPQTTTQRHRRPATHQPRPQRLWAVQLAAEYPVDLEDLWVARELDPDFAQDGHQCCAE
jgi:transposase InsO family protein